MGVIVTLTMVRLQLILILAMRVLPRWRYGGTYANGPGAIEWMSKTDMNGVRIILTFALWLGVKGVLLGQVTPANQTVPTFSWAPNGQGGFTAPNPNKHTIQITLTPGGGSAFR